MIKNLTSLKKDLNIVIYFLKISHNISKTYIPSLICSSIFKALTPFINIILPKFIIDELLGEKRIKVFIMLTLIIIISNFILNFINKWFDSKLNIKNLQIMKGFDELIGKRIMEMSFDKIEDPNILDLKERALQPIHNQNAIYQLVNNIVTCMSETITILGLVAIISTLNFLIVAFIILIVMLNSIIFKKSQEVQYNFYQGLTPLNRAFYYYCETTSDFSYAKEMRLYKMSPLVMKKLDDYGTQSIDKFQKLFNTMGKLEGLNKINIQIQIVSIYAYMIYEVFNNYISLGSFSMYISSASKFSTSISNFSNSFIEFRQMCRYLELYMEFEKIGKNNYEILNPVKIPDSYNIEFKNVSFKYPKSLEYTLKNISLKIDSGEKLSVVGLNGAGKTTFIKLLTRLYEPTEGEILLNGVNINSYNYIEYMSLLSVVFQDFKLLSFSIKENIALNKYNTATDTEIWDILKKVGLDSDISKLNKGIFTNIFKNFEKDGIELSGGQSQKLAIARALYKNAPIVILDEPTAALDPISEYDIYTKFNKLINNKTTIYISHRLSSCRFCDKIALFHNGEIIQYGSHNELIKQSGKNYEKMYMAQAQYYI